MQAGLVDLSQCVQIQLYFAVGRSSFHRSPKKLMAEFAGNHTERMEHVKPSLRQGSARNTTEVLAKGGQ